MSANNKFYFKAFNQDYQSGGVYADLDSSELCVLIKLHAYSDGDGFVWQVDKRGYKLTQLTTMLNLNPRTVKKALFSLQSKELITISDNDVIIIKSWNYDQIERSESSSSVGARIAKAKAQGIQQGKEAIIESTVREINARTIANKTKGGKKNE